MYTEKNQELCVFHPHVAHFLVCEKCFKPICVDCQRNYYELDPKSEIPKMIKSDYCWRCYYTVEILDKTPFSRRNIGALIFIAFCLTLGIIALLNQSGIGFMLLFMAFFCMGAIFYVDFYHYYSKRKEIIHEMRILISTNNFQSFLDTKLEKFYY